MKDIEPKILPLVQALNSIGLVCTFSSCEGHFDEINRFNDHNKADVRFDPADNVSDNDIEKFISYIITRFSNLHSFTPVIATAHKLYAPIGPEENKEIDFVYVFQLIPFDHGDPPNKKRRFIDKAILDAAAIVKEYHPPT
jgi:hypothetical protein